MNEDVFPIENGGVSNVMFVFGVCIRNVPGNSANRTAIFIECVVGVRLDP